MRFYVGDHFFTIISHTSVDVEPNPMGFITLMMSERMDGVLCANNKTGNYKI